MAGRWMMASIQMSFAIMPAAVYWLAGQSFVGGAISIGTVVAFTTLQTRLFWPIQGLLNVQIDVQTSLALFDRIFEYLDLPVDIAEVDDAAPRSTPVRGDVSYEQVGFRYDAETDVDAQGRVAGRAGGHDYRNRRRDGLGQDDARLPRRQAVRRRPGRGHDRRRRRPRPVVRALAELVGVVSQETYLFHASVRENLRFARPDATDEEVEAAARAAQIHHVIAALPDGYDTVVGERGYRFSGGEKQRIAIARTVLRNPPILVLDEATSALDTQTERLVQEALDGLCEGRTTIAIAHRLSTIREADQIVVLDDGRVAERGTHDELMLLGGRYAELVTRDARIDDALAALITAALRPPGADQEPRRLSGRLGRPRPAQERPKAAVTAAQPPGPRSPIGRTITGAESEEAVMAVAMLASHGSQEIYDKVRQSIGLEVPAGGIFHVAGPSPNGGWRVIEVWESEEDAYKFFNERLKPALEAAGVTAPPPDRSSGRCTTT